MLTDYREQLEIQNKGSFKLENANEPRYEFITTDSGSNNLSGAEIFDWNTMKARAESCLQMEMGQ